MRAPGNRLLSIAMLSLCVLMGAGSLFANPSESSGPLPLTLAAWRSSDLQRAVERRIGLLIAQSTPIEGVYNQMLWSMLAVTPPRMQLVIGRDREFYGKFSVQEFCDTWPALDTREADFREFIVDTKALAEQMRVRGRSFMVVTTPSKSATFPDGLPRLQCNGEARNRVPPRLIAALRGAGVPLVDGVAITRRAAHESPFSIFPRYGIHWNEWGAYPTVAATLKLAAAQLGDPPPSLDVSNVSLIAEPMEIVVERTRAMGLYRGPREERVPSVRFNLSPGGSRRRATIVGDSFAKAMIDVLGSVDAFASIERFNYLTEFHDSHPGGLHRSNLKVDDIDWARDVFGSDVVILEINEMLDLPEFARIFVHEALRRMPATMPAGAPSGPL